MTQIDKGADMLGTDRLGTVLQRLYEVIESRKDADPKSSYTASLLAKGPARCAKKFGEEAVEAVIAGTTSDKAELTAEGADTLYHLLVLMASVGVTPNEVAQTLADREGISGHDEKAGRE